MPTDELFSKSERAFLRELQRRRVRFLIVGLSAATLQGVPVVTQDVDLWFANPGSQRIGGESVKLFDVVTGMDGLDSFATECRRAKTIRIGNVRVPVLPLDRIIVSKRAANRRKDRLTLPVLEDAVTTLAARRRRRR